MPLLVEHRIMRVRMRFITLWQQDRGAQIDGLSPELREQFTLNLDVLYVLRIAGRKRSGNLVVQIEPDFISRERIKMKMTGIAIEVSRRFIELLAFPLVHMGKDSMAVRTLKTRIHIEQRLDVIVPCRQFTHGFKRKAQRQSVNRRRSAWL